eukprot:UN03912
MHAFVLNSNGLSNPMEVGFWMYSPYKPLLNTAFLCHDGCKRSLLHFICERGYGASARVLLMHGANLDMEDSRGKTPYDIMAESNDPELKELYQIIFLLWGCWKFHVGQQDCHLPRLPKVIMMKIFRMCL